MGWFTSANNCTSNKCLGIILNVSSQTIVDGETIKLTGEAEDPEGDPLAYYWYSSEASGPAISGLGVESGRPYGITETTYTAPLDSHGKSIRITVKVNDYACGEMAESSTKQDERRLVSYTDQ